jgi:dipeptidyl aminopeptidase/acylaminoacyl peptidase
MRKVLSFISLALLIGCADAPVEVTNYSIEQFSDNISIGGGSFSADESKLLVSSDETGIYNIYSLNVDGSGKEQLTFSEKETFFGISWFPQDDRFLYSADQGGNELNHIYLQDTEGIVTDLTPWEGSVSRFSGWTRDDKAFYFSSNKRDPRYFDLYKMDIEDFSPELIYENTENLSIGTISSTGKFMALTKSITNENNEMYLLNLESGKLEHISEHEGDATFYPAGFSLDEKYLYYRTDEGREFTCVSLYDLETGEKKNTFEADWDVQYTYFSYNEKYQVIGINQDAKTVVKLLEMPEGNEVEMPSFGDLDITGVSIPKSEKSIRLAAGSSTSPGDLYMYEFGKEDYIRLTHSLNKEIMESDLVSAEVIRYPSFDGLEIPAILYKPKQASKKNKVPAVLFIHGGPGGQSRTGFSDLVQFLVNHEYVVLAVNNRGSSGYGKTFYSLDNQRHGEDDLMDCVKAKDFLAGLDYVDIEKVGIMGGSYGGYMTMAALAFQPEEFAVGVNIFGVTNWLRTLKSIPPYWEAFREALYNELGDPYSADSIRLHKISPLFHAANVTKPLMVLQGANDVRVLQAESDEIVEAVEANGVPVEYIVFDDEGHGFRKKENQIEGYGQVLVFLDKYLKGTVEE